MSSREIAEITGKRHDNVCRDIRDMLSVLAHSSDLRDEQYQQVTEVKDYRGFTAEFLLPRDLTMTLVMGYSIPLRYAVVKRWEELEEQFAFCTRALPSNSEGLPAIMRQVADRLETLDAGQEAVAGQEKSPPHLYGVVFGSATGESWPTTPLRVPQMIYTGFLLALGLFLGFLAICLGLRFLGWAIKGGWKVLLFVAIGPVVWLVAMIQGAPTITSGTASEWAVGAWAVALLLILANKDRQKGLRQGRAWATSRTRNGLPPAPAGLTVPQAMEATQQALAARQERISAEVQALQAANPHITRRGWSGTLAERMGVEHASMMESIRQHLTNFPELLGLLGQPGLPPDLYTALTDYVGTERDAGRLPLNALASRESAHGGDL